MANKYEVILRRHHEVKNVKKTATGRLEDATVGILTVYKNSIPIYDCFTIENGGASTATANQDKRIMPGDYQLGYSNTSVPLPPSCNKKGIILKDPKDPSFVKRRIFIHVGNYPQDTEGCILLNGSYNMTAKEGFGYRSKPATEEFYNIFKDEGVSDVTFRLVELGQLYNFR